MLRRKAREWRLCISAKDWIVEPTLLKHRKLITKASLRKVAQLDSQRRNTDSNMD